MLPDSLQVKMLDYIRRYVKRQELVSAIIHELRPDLVFVAENMPNWTVEKNDELKRLHDSVRAIPQGGYWGINQEWQYFFHGGGCRLTHTVTGEPINWNLPDVTRFDKFWFVDHLEWVLSQENGDMLDSIWNDALSHYAGSLQAFTFAMLEQLSSLGYLSPSDSQNGYRLLQS